MPILKIEFSFAIFEPGGFEYVRFYAPDFSLSRGKESEFSKAFWKLFVKGRQVQGSINTLEVEISDKELKTMQLIRQTEYDRKIKVWQDFNSNKCTSEELLMKLEEELPVWVLKMKLTK